METRYLKLTFRQPRKGDIVFSIHDKLNAEEERKHGISRFKRSQFHILHEIDGKLKISQSVNGLIRDIQRNID